MSVAKGFSSIADDSQPHSGMAQDWVQVAELRSAEAITGGESRWLIDRLMRDGGISACEQRLIDFLAEESPNIHESLTRLIRDAA